MSFIGRRVWTCPILKQRGLFKVEKNRQTVAFYAGAGYGRKNGDAEIMAKEER
jgi:hypothetical protein